VGVRALIAALG